MSWVERCYLLILNGYFCKEFSIKMSSMNEKYSSSTYTTHKRGVHHFCQELYNYWFILIHKLNTLLDGEKDIVRIQGPVPTDYGTRVKHNTVQNQDLGEILPK